MYLSKVEVNTGAEAAQAFLNITENGPYGAHQLLWQLFSTESERSFLYRQEIKADGGTEYFVLSEVPPQKISNVFSVQTKLFAPLLKERQRLAFKLRANATVCKNNEDGKSKRHDVLMDAKRRLNLLGKTCPKTIQAGMNEAAYNWLSNERRLRSWGIELDNLPEIERYTLHRSQKKSGHHIQFSSVDFQGVLTVMNPDVFLHQYHKGFGRSKALGCGLMLIRAI